MNRGGVLLQFVTGRAGSGKTEYLKNIVIELAEKPENDKRIMMIVPEQYSFGTETAILKAAGPKTAAKIDVVSFTRLGEMVSRLEGGVAGKYLSEGGRRVMMNLAIDSCQDSLDIYAPVAKTGKITDIMLTAVSEMKLCGIDENSLIETSKLCGESVLSKKLYELALIYRTYNSLISASYLDSRDDLTRLYDKLKSSEFFRGATVAVDSFEGFTAQETRVLSAIMGKAEKLVVALCTDNVPEMGTGLFALVNRTKRKLKLIAGEQGIKTAPDIRLYEGKRFKNPALSAVEEGLFGGGQPGTWEDSEGVSIYAARDIYEETEYTAATIRKLVSEEGYRYGDFTVICRNTEMYALILGSELRKRDIPCFVSKAEPVETSPLMRFVLSALDITIQGISTDRVLEMHKTGLSEFTAEEISDLENYAFLWGLKGSDWREPFVKHPKGFGYEMDDEASARLDYLNGLRIRAVIPLVKFRKGVTEATGSGISRAIYDMLMDFHIDETLPEYCRSLEELGEQTLAEKQVRVWELLVSVLEQMADILGDKPVSKDRYCDLLKNIIHAEDLSEIPGTSDEVTFGAPEQVRQSTPKVLFVLGAVQGEFPGTPSSSGVFSDAERKQLIAYDLPLGDPLEQKAIEERYLAYSSVCLASERLYISYYKNSGGDSTEPSEIVNGVMGIFPGLKISYGYPAWYFANSGEAAFSKMASVYRVKSGEASALRKLFNENSEYAGRLEALKRAADDRAESIAGSTAIRLFGETPHISASQIEKYYSCKFQYFCRFGLGTKERRAAKIDLMQYGTIMHFLLEKFFNRENEAGEISKLSDEELFTLVDEYIVEYADKNMGGYNTMTDRDIYRLHRMKQTAAQLIRHTDEELSQSEFRPEFFEMKLDRGSKYPPLRIKTPNGNTAYVIGTVDRVDFFDSSDGRYVRVIDYKTGTKDFKLKDVLAGLNMQMLVYLAALVQNENSGEKPAGILYTPLKVPSVSGEKGDTKEAVAKKTDTSLRMNGLVLSDSEIVTAMENQGLGKYIPSKLDKDGSVKDSEYVVSRDEMNTLLDYSKRLIASMTDTLLEGDIMAAPNRSDSLPCKFCPYGTVCGREFDQEDAEKISLKKQEVFEIIREETQNGG